MPRNTSAKTASNAAMSAVRTQQAHPSTPVQLVDGARHAERDECRQPDRLVRRDGDACVAERLAEAGQQRRAVSGMCAELVERASTGAVLSLSKGSGRMFDRQPGGPGELLIFDVLQHRAERPVHCGRIHCAHAEQLERGNPVDGLGDARPFLQVQPT